MQHRASAGLSRPWERGRTRSRGPLVRRAAAPCEAGAARAGGAPRSVQGSQPTQVIHWGWRGAAAPSNPRPGEAPPCLLITPPPSHSPMTEARMARTRTWTAAAGYLAGGSRGPDQSVDPPCPQRRSMAFPPGITVEGATPAFEGGGKVARGLATFPPARGAPAPKNRGSLPPPSPPPVRRHDAPCEAGTRGGGGARGFTPEDLGNPCQPASNADFRAQPGPQRRGLRPLIVQICNCQNRAPPGCATPPL